MGPRSSDRRASGTTSPSAKDLLRGRRRCGARGRLDNAGLARTPLVDPFLLLLSAPLLRQLLDRALHVAKHDGGQRLLAGEPEAQHVQAAGRLRNLGQPRGRVVHIFDGVVV